MASSHARLVVAALTWIVVTGCGGGGSQTDRAWCERPDGPYEGERALFAAYCDALSRCDAAAQLGYAFRCRQECVETFEFGLTCSIEDDGSDVPFGGRLVARTLAYDEARGAECIAWLAAADCDAVTRFLASGSSTSVGSDDE